MPTWSPDGRVIAFVRFHTRPQRRFDDSGFDHHIWTVGADGTGERRLSDGPVHDLEPAYSPDGTRIAFTRYVDGEIIRKGRSGHSAVRLCVMNADGTGVQVLTEEPAGYASPTWSPDGTWLVCSRSIFGPSHVFVLDAEGSNGHAITHPDKDEDYDPAWRPPGRLSRVARLTGARRTAAAISSVAARRELHQRPG